MARRRMSDPLQAPLTRSLSTPAVYLMQMFVFLVFVGLIATILSTQFLAAFQSNPGLNSLIIVVLLCGIVFSFHQVIRLYPEIRWVNAFRIADPGLAISHRPVLLAPMATMLRDRTGVISLSTVSMRSIMDSIGSRLDEARDTGRYTIGLLVFLGLLGTFWGLLDTIQSVGKTISALDTSSNDSAIVFQELKTGLAEPLRGMGTAFASSLFGLSGSLIVGFLELQANHAHNRFYNELEDWLSGITELTPAGAASPGTDQINRQIYNAMFEIQRSLSELADRLQANDNQSVQQLSHGVNQLLSEMRREQEIVRQWADDQSSQQHEIMNMIRDLI
ncbi:MAG: flagellar motor protein MotA, partial [Pseudomonadota bacterium]